jgi:hypothetical protein
MKKTALLLLTTFFAFASCSSDNGTGPQGPPGVDGEDGLIASIIEVEGNFNANNNYTISVNFSDYNIEVFESDVVMVYIKAGETEDANGAPVDVFRALPQTYYINGKALLYNFDFTFFDSFIFLDGNVDFSTLDASYTQGIKLRIAVIPADYANSPESDIYNLNSVIEDLNIQPLDIKTLN